MPCGSELARDEASKRNILIDCGIAFASKLAPTGETRSHPNQVGIDVECLLTNLSETLASASATISDLAFELEGSRRHVALGVQQLIELSE
ncbi:DUF6124 family protein [Pseudomonas sp. NFACC14]|uniref:DUF6124 family protein n=1 Tax=unclassified Pseudomonas TaxID=196821 RepID=UPI003531D8B8